MTATYDLNTNIGKVRLLINDVVIASPHFTDEEIQVFLDLNGNSVYPAAAAALESWAASLSESTESERIGDYSYTKKQVANKLALAEKYRQMETEPPALSWAEMDLTGGSSQ